MQVTTRAVVKHFGIKKVTIISGKDDAFTNSGYDVFKALLTSQNIPVTIKESYAKEDVAFKASNSDVIVCCCLTEEDANIIL